MINQEIKEYAEAVIVAFERKKTIKSKKMKVSELKQVLTIIRHYLDAKKRGVYLEAYLAETKTFWEIITV